MRDVSTGSGLQFDAAHLRRLHRKTHSWVFPRAFLVGASGETRLEERSELLCEGEDAVEVEPEHTVPCLVGVFGIALTPVVSTIVDEHVDVCTKYTSELTISRAAPPVRSRMGSV